MRSAIDYRTADDRSVDVTLCLVVLIIVSKKFYHIIIFHFVKTFVLLRVETLFEKYNCVLVTVTNKTFILLAEFPFLTCIIFKILFVRMNIITWILVPNQLRIIALSCNDKVIKLAIVISPNAFSFFSMLLQLIILYNFRLFTHN